MADLRSKFIEDYAGGLLNVSRQELSSTGEVLSQDGFLSDATLFVEDGSGTKSGLKLGTTLCEVVDPTTPQGAINVRYADRTYASTRDLKIFSTAIASAQAALSDATATSITNLENAFQLLETTQDTLQNKFDANVDFVNGRLDVVDKQVSLADQVKLLEDRTGVLQNTLTSFVTEDRVINSSRFYVRTGTNAQPSVVQFYKTRGEVAESNGSLFKDDEIGVVEFAGNDGNDKVVGSRIVGKVASAWNNDERATYIGFNWVGTEETGAAATLTEWIAFGKPFNGTDPIGPKTITFESIPEVPSASNARPDVQINTNGQLVKSLAPAITLNELKTLTAAAADFAAFKTAMAALT